jgi:putative transposase
VFTPEVDKSLMEICAGISKRYEIYFVEIGSDKDHVHFLIQSVPTISPTRLAQTVKSITAKELFKKHAEIKEKLWRGHFWTSGFYINTVSQFGNETVIKNYVRNQGKVYSQISRQQLTMFEDLI